MNDLATLLLGMAVTVAAVLLWMWRYAERKCNAQRRQAEELACWGELQIEEINALRTRLAAAQPDDHADRPNRPPAPDADLDTLALLVQFI